MEVRAVESRPGPRIAATISLGSPPSTARRSRIWNSRSVERSDIGQILGATRLFEQNVDRARLALERRKIDPIEQHVAERVQVQRTEFVWREQSRHEIEGGEDRRVGERLVPEYPVEDGRLQRTKRDGIADATPESGKRLLSALALTSR